MKDLKKFISQASTLFQEAAGWVAPPNQGIIPRKRKTWDPRNRGSTKEMGEGIPRNRVKGNPNANLIKTYNY